MSLDGSDPALRALLARLGPFARELVLRSGLHAARLHADAVTPDHLLSTLMDEPDSAAAAAVLHAFADPETISGEALALSPGVMVVASDSTLPFSPRGVAALFAARAAAEERGAEGVGTDDLLRAALAELGPELHGRLAAVGLAGLSASIAPAARAAGAAGAFVAGESVFRHFSLAAKRALSAANRSAASARQAAISPAHVVLGCLKADEELAQRCDLGFGRARMLFGDRTADESALAPRSLPADADLVAFLAALPAAASTVDLLIQFHAGGTPELARILLRHKLSAELLARAREAFRDPAIAG